LRDARETSGARVRWGLALSAVLLLLGVALVRREEGTASRPTPPAVPGSAPAPRASRSEPSSRGGEPLDVTGEALSAALHEERVRVASGVVVERIDSARPWVCTGEPLGLSARLGGASEPEMVSRWVWLTPDGGAELHPGPALDWRAPAKEGRYRVRFQVCKDLGGRRVGVLAEREVEVEVRACGAGERQADEPLRIELAQRRHGAFAFQALYSGRETVEAYAWDFGDGTREVTREPRVEHAYPVRELGAQELKSYTVRLQVLAGGKPLSATAFALTRGQPPVEEPPVELEVSRWRPQADGGWRSEVVVRNPHETAVTWERLERVTVRWDGHADISTRPWREGVHVEEDLGLGSFRGYVTVHASEVPPEVKQLLDSLYGTDGTGKEVVVSWSPFKREPSASPVPPPEPPPAQ
jgi:hypothetical protein